ncbi:hypothetical protein GJAV_G00163400 [Gymnothorax javanicus]|nr:hypothetical protein GJAV_G00163400 [Gymnothorax javanicus]
MICWGESTFWGFGLDSPCQDHTTGTAGNHPLTSAKKDRITAVSLGKRIIAIVTENGEGRICFQKGMSEITDRQKPENIALENEKIDTLSCGRDFIVMVSEKGNVFQLNCKKKNFHSQVNIIFMILTHCAGLRDCTTKIIFMLLSYIVQAVKKCLSALNARQVIQVACGDQHTIALSRDGQLFTWGKNLNGQLGLGEAAPSSQTPKRLFSLSGVPLAMIAAGGDHSFALSLSGTVYAWGRNNKGQLGVGDKEDRYVPSILKSLNLKGTVFISCGYEHTAALSKGGVMFTFGSGEYGQLGHNSFRDELQPRLVAELWGSRVTQIACGGHHTLVYVASLKKVYSFGCGEQGQLGNGQASNQNVPLPVPLSSEFDDGIGTILAGGSQSFCCHETLPFTCKTTFTVDKLIDKWMKECDSTPWKTTEKEIMQAFSSLSAVNGSFLNQRDAGGNEKMVKQVGSVVQRTLIPSLPDGPSGVEDLRVYLILPELLRVLPMNREICVRFAEAVCRLQPQSWKILEGLWSKLPQTFFKSLVKTVHSTAAWFFNQMRTEIQDYFYPLEMTVQLLQKLFEVNYSSRRKIGDRNFCIKELMPFIQSWETFQIDARHLLFEGACLESSIAKLPVCEPKIPSDRYCPSIEKQCQPQSNHHSNYHSPLKVVFLCEAGIDHGGLSQEFFTLIAREICSLDSGMLQHFEDSGLAWFMTEGHSDDDTYYLLGILCGMALYNFCVVNFHFPLALYKKLLGLMPTLEDLKELSPTEARNLVEVLQADEEVLELMYLDFTAKGQEMVPKGREIPVTKCNRQQFVEAYIDFVFNNSVQKQFSDFSEGFSKGCPNGLWKMFLPDELMAKIIGNVYYIWEELQKNAVYEGYEPTDANIKNFWTVFFELSEEEKKNFLCFMRGSDRLPIGGLAKMKIIIVNRNRPNPDDFYPVANTCYGCLYLPNYSSIDILKEKFHHAISFYEEFGAS